MEKLINIIMYTTWKELSLIYHILDFVHPVTWLLKIKAVNKFFIEKRGVDLNKALHKQVFDIDYGQCYYASVLLTSVCVSIYTLSIQIYATFVLDFEFLRIIRPNDEKFNKLAFLFVALLIAGLLLSVYIENNRFKIYYKRFQSLGLNKRRKLILVGVLVQLFSIVFFYVAFKFTTLIK